VLDAPEAPPQDITALLNLPAVQSGALTHNTLLL